jgi:hypothetical protein
MVYKRESFFFIIKKKYFFVKTYSKIKTKGISETYGFF